MRLNEITNKHHGLKGDYPEAYAFLLYEMSIVVSMTIDEGGNFDDAIQVAMEDFADDIDTMGLDPLKVENDQTFEEQEDVMQFLSQRGRT